MKILIIGATVVTAQANEMKKQAFAAVKIKADRGDANSQFALGGMYYQGIVTKRNFTMAAKMYEKAVDQGHLNAMYNLGEMYSRGEGVKKDIPMAINLFSKAANAGDTKSIIHLADILVTAAAPDEIGGELGRKCLVGPCDHADQ